MFMAWEPLRKHKFTPQCADYFSQTPVEDMLHTEYQMLGMDELGYDVELTYRKRQPSEIAAN